jgi:hypothetical protein
MQAKAEQGSLAFLAHASAMQAKVASASSALQDTPSSDPTATRTAIKAIIDDLVTAVATGAAMPRDAMHMQHLSNWADWYVGGAKKKGLKLDCAGRVLAIYCFAQVLSSQVTSLQRVCMVVSSKPGLVDPTAWQTQVDPISLLSHSSHRSRLRAKAESLALNASSSCTLSTELSSRLGLVV